MSCPLSNNGLLPEKLYVKDTIAAIATGRGAAGVGIVRVSGGNTAKIKEKIIGKKLEPNIATYCNFYNAKHKIIDNGIAIYFKAPNSFTGEDVLELQGHGGFIVLNRVLQSITADNAARIAEPGEFTKRAYLNNKLDLVQAEAVLDLIHAGSVQAADAALKSLSGDFSKLINQIQQELISLRMFVEAALDFPEEEINFLTNNNVLNKIDNLIKNIKYILSRATQGVLLAEGVDTVILGQPNVGKSSLLNRLTKEDTSIITNIPGTTRDLIKAKINLKGISLNLVDTAGLRESIDPIECEGIARAKASAKQAELILYVIDTLPNNVILDELASYKTSTNSIILVINKIDKLNITPKILLNNDLCQVYISAKNDLGIDLLEKAISDTLGNINQEGVFSARTRHLVALNRTVQHIEQGQEQMITFKAIELLAEELKLAQMCMNQITGEFSADDLLGKIFSEFCIGK